MGLLSRKNKESSKRKDRERSVALDAETVEEVERLMPAVSEPAESEYESRRSRPINADPINSGAGGTESGETELGDAPHSPDPAGQAQDVRGTTESGTPADSQADTPGREPSAESLAGTPGQEAPAEQQPAGSGREAEQPAVDETSNPDMSQSAPDSSETDTEAARSKESDPEADGSTEAEPEPARMHAMDLIAPSRSPIPGFPHAKPGDSDPGSETARPKAPVKEAHVISFANQKGGVAKTTTTLNLAVAFAETGHSVLCVDLDPQGNLTMSQGVDPDKVETSMYDVLVHDVPIIDVIVEREIDIAVASIDLAGAEIAMSTKIGRERSLEKALAEVKPYYDFICIDTPPSLGLLTINALTASDKVIVPVQCEYLSMRGLVQLQNTLRMIQENLNPEVQIEGILPTMLDARTVHAKEAIEILEENFGDLVFKSRIRKAIKFAEAPVRGSSVLKYDPQGNAANCYRELAKEVLTHGSA